MDRLILILLFCITAFASNPGSLALRDTAGNFVTLTDSSLNVNITNDTVWVKIYDTTLVKIQSTDTIKIWDGNLVWAMDGSFDAGITIDPGHHEIHEGRHFYYKSYATLGNNDSTMVLFVVTDTTRWPHILFATSPQDGKAYFRLHRGVTVSDSGVQITPVNRDENSLNESVHKVFLGPTITDYGTTIGTYVAGSGKKSGGEVRSNNELVGKQNTLYLGVIDNASTSANEIDILVDWYEHINKN